MALRFLADHCVSNQIIQTLREAGHEVVRLKDVLPVESADSQVIATAQEIDAILLSLNGDFADIVAYPPRRFAGIVSLQLHNHPEVIPALMKLLLAHLASFSTMQDYLGKLLVVGANRIRIRE